MSFNPPLKSRLSVNKVKKSCLPVLTTISCVNALTFLFSKKMLHASCSMLSTIVEFTEIFFETCRLVVDNLFFPLNINQR